MTIAGGPGEFLGVGRGSQWRRSHGGFATTVGDIGGRIRGLVTAEGDVTIPIRIEGMKTAILVLDLGETQAILKAEGNLSDVNFADRFVRGGRLTEGHCFNWEEREGLWLCTRWVEGV
jgi:hypothetical protein